MNLTEYLTEYFSRDDELNKFHNSEYFKIYFVYTTVSNNWFGCWSTNKYLPYNVSNKEIADALKTIIKVPFTLTIDRTGPQQQFVWLITITRVFMPNERMSV